MGKEVPRPAFENIDIGLYSHTQTPFLAGKGTTMSNGRHFQTDLEQGGEEQTLIPGDVNTVADGFVKSLVFGGFDGVISSIVVISGCAGAQIPWNTVLTLGLAYLTANSLYVGFSEFLSSNAHRVFLQSEKRREIWEFNHYRTEEIKNMADRFEARGMGRKDAELVLTKMAKYESFFVRMMMSEQLGSQLTDVDDTPLLVKDAMVMFVSFASFGVIPFIFYFLGECLVPRKTPHTPP